MFFLTLILAAGGESPTEDLARRMLPLYTQEAADYAIAVETAGKVKTPAELKKEPVFEWSNTTRIGLQQGVVFLWLRDGRPAAVASIFSQPHEKPAGRQVIHEFHALDPEKLIVARPAGAINQWKPQAGLVRKDLTDAPAPAASPAARLIQMRKLAQEFSGHETDEEEKRWDLRVLPAPLYRYPTAASGVIDGALFTLVSSAGTDPEVLLLIEAREEKGKVRWMYACGRFSDRSLYVKRNDAEIWSMVRGAVNTFNNDAQHLYSLYADKVVDVENKVIARVKVTEKVPWGEIVSIGGKR